MDLASPLKLLTAPQHPFDAIKMVQRIYIDTFEIASCVV